MKWWLISDDTLQIVRKALQAPTHEANDFNCQDWPPGSGCCGCAGDRLRREALHELESGSHITEAVPEDWQEGDRKITASETGEINESECGETLEQLPEALRRTFCEHIAAQLTRVLEKDPDTIASLFNLAVVDASERLVDDPFVQLRRDGKGAYRLSIIGLLNAITVPYGYYLMADYESTTGWQGSDKTCPPEYYNRVAERVRLVGFHVEPTQERRPAMEWQRRGQESPSPQLDIERLRRLVEQATDALSRAVHGKLRDLPVNVTTALILLRDIQQELSNTGLRSEKAPILRDYRDA